MNYRSPLFNFLLGTAAGAVLATVPLLEHFAHVAQRHDGEMSQRFVQLDNQNAANHFKIAELEGRNSSCAAELQKASAIERAAAQEQDAQDFRDRFFTLVYEPQPEFAPSAQGQAVAAILNLYRPGLGTVLARLQAPPQPGMQLRMVLRGYVRPEQLPMGVHLVYTLNPEAVAASGQVQ